MGVPEPSPERKAFDYAEQVLGVHQIHDQALVSRNHLEELHKQLLAERNRRRQLESALRDREMEVAEEVYNQHANESQAARDRLLKVALNNDGDVRETKEDLVTLAGQIDFLEFEVERVTQDIKIAVARMQELGGYLTYLAVIKQASNARQSNTADGNPWI